jgi:DNA ligase D-like protein (predicted 3'-phosphoesterase)
VVQRHHATNVHFDLRLEVDGALASWAVPKGPSLDPAAKRLAVRVDDHEMAHATYENDVTGRGSVVIWDTGRFENVTERQGRPVPSGEALDRGHIRFVLHGEKLTGGFALTRTRMGGDPKNWILVKIDDDGAVRDPEA